MSFEAAVGGGGTGVSASAPRRRASGPRSNGRAASERRSDPGAAPADRDDRSRLTLPLFNPRRLQALGVDTS